MEKTLKLISIGNSRGVRIPQSLIQRYNLHDEVRVTETAEGLLLHASDSEKMNLEQSFAAMAKDREALAETEMWATTLGDGLDDLPGDEFKDWPR